MAGSRQPRPAASHSARGIADATVTSLSQELGRDVTTDEALPVLERHLPLLAGLAAAT